MLLSSCVRTTLKWLQRTTAGLALSGCCAALAAAQTPESAGQVLFAAGEIALERSGHPGQAVKKGTALQQGDLLKTHTSGYIYVRMADQALLVLRPNSSLRIDRWQYRPEYPEQSEIKYTLDHGVARYVSGQGSKAAKDKFRFNTPLAAIGVRGTDFTVFADPHLTRVSVSSGGVVVSPFDGVCVADGLGPCEGERVSELFANNSNKMLEVSLHDLKPRLVQVAPHLNTETQAPKTDRPASSGSAPSESLSDSEHLKPEVVEIDLNGALGNAPTPSPGAPETPAPQPPGPPMKPQPVVSWGRWGEIDGESDLATFRQVIDGRTIVSSNKHYVMAINPGAVLEVPGAGVADFQLVQHEGMIRNVINGSMEASTASNGRLSIDFGERRFNTSLDLQVRGITTNIYSSGNVEANGVLRSDPFVSQTSVGGVIGGAGATEASYIYHRSPGVGLEVSGFTRWSR